MTADAILVESQARSTGENIAPSRALLKARALLNERMVSALLVSKPYKKRRSYATACKISAVRCCLRAGAVELSSRHQSLCTARGRAALLEARPLPVPVFASLRLGRIHDEGLS